MRKRIENMLEKLKMVYLMDKGHTPIWMDISTLGNLRVVVDMEKDLILGLMEENI